MLGPRSLSASVELASFRTPTIPPASHTNSYALGSREVILVEPATPYEPERRAFLEWARAFRSSGRSLVAIVVTHHHKDHVGGAEFLARELGLPLWMHAETEARLPLEAARILTEGDRIVLEGPIPTAWRVLHTPGHAPGHVCLHSADTREMVVGDMVAGQGTILVPPASGDGDMAEYLRQLRRLASLDAFVAYPAHGEPVERPERLCRAYVAHRLAREARIVEVLTIAPGRTADELVDTVYGEVPLGTRPFALLSLESHLEKLVAEGRVHVTGHGAEARYT
jgi:glyoxylase-like metal-dependent hydrolase (beta-lactamase superfamily II)